MGDIATCGTCHAPTQRECAQCPFNCDLHPHCQDQGCEADPTSCKRVMDRERDICNGVCKTAAEWIALQEAKTEPPASAKLAWDALCALEHKLTPPGRLAFTRIDASDAPRWPCRGNDNPLNAPYGVKFIHEGNPGDPYSWVAEMFMRQQHTEKLMSAADYALRCVGQVLAPIYLYVVGMVAAFLIASAAAAGAYTPLVCHADGWGYIVCTPMMVNPSAKIIHIEPIERVERLPLAPPVEIAPVPLPRPRPLNLGEPQANVAPIDRPRQMIQQ